MGSLLLAGATLIGCSKSNVNTASPIVGEPVVSGSVQYTINLSTGNTKAVTDPGDGTGTLTVTWKQGDSVSVYNATTGTQYAEKLYAQEDGAATTLKGTFKGNFNIGDVLELTYIGKDNANAVQTGLLNSEAEGVTIENTFDCAFARIEVQEIQIDEEAGLADVITDDAYFERQQAIVKFTLQNRKATPEAVLAKDFHITIGEGAEAPVIKVHPAEPMDVLYVALPAFENKKLTLEAEGADGYSYRLVSPDATMVNGAFYTRTVQMKRLALVDAPVAKTGLVYNTSAQVLLDSAQVYWMVNGVKEYVTYEKDKNGKTSTIYYKVTEDETQPAENAEGWSVEIPSMIHADTCYVWTKMVGNYDYEDVEVSESPVKVSIAKATPTINVAAATDELIYNGQARSLLSAAATLTLGETDVTSVKDASNKACTVQYYVSTSGSTPAGGSWGTSYTVTNAGNWLVWVKVTGNGDMTDVAQTMMVNKSIAKATPTVTAPTAKSGLTYNGNSQALVNAGSTTGGTLQYKVDNGVWGASVPTATNAGTYTVYYRVVGGNNYNDNNGSSFTVTVNKAAGYLELGLYSFEWDYDTYELQYRVVVFNNHGGAISTQIIEGGDYFACDGYYAVWGISHSFFHPRTGTLRVTCGETANYTAAYRDVSLRISDFI